jgi:predicted Zn-dependent protease
MRQFSLSPSSLPEQNLSRPLGDTAREGSIRYFRQEKIELLAAATSEVKKNVRILTGTAALTFRADDKYFASSEGSSIQQYLLQTYGNVDATAVDTEKGFRELAITSRPRLPPDGNTCRK